MKFCKIDEQSFDLVYQMMLRAREKLFSEGIYQWDHRYPTPEMILGDLKNGYTTLVKSDRDEDIAFFISNSICEDDVHNEVQWNYDGDAWVILHRLCVDPKWQNGGLGQQILCQFEENTKNQGFSCIRIDVFATNAAAIHIYEKHGYQRVGECVCERGPFYVYEKIL